MQPKPNKSQEQKRSSSDPDVHFDDLEEDALQGRGKGLLRRSAEVVV